MANWYAGAVIYRMNGGQIEFLVIDTRSVNPKYKGSPVQTKFVGGTEEGHLTEDVTVIGTFHRELHEETDMMLPAGYSLMVVHSVNMPGHFKNFYLIPFGDLKGELRTVEKTIDGDWMSAPYWLSFPDACRKIFKSHQDALMKAHQRLRERAA